MNDVSRLASSTCAFCVAMTLSAVSLAHVDLSSPNPRAHGETEGDLKSGPCGQTANGRTSNVNVFAPGETITVTFNEYIDHPAYYRIAFDDDGDDGFAMRTDGQTVPDADDPEAMEAALNMDAEILAIVPEVNDTTPGVSTDVRNVDVTLPNITCENCTLQVIQYMYNNPGQGYFQCADIALRAAQTTGDAGPGGEGGSANAGEAGAAGAVGAGAGGAPASGNAGTGNGSGGTGGAPTPSGGSGGAAGASPASGGSASTAGGSGPAVAADSEDDGGCAIAWRTESGAGRAGLASLLALGLGLVARRRRA